MRRYGGGRCGMDGGGRSFGGGGGCDQACAGAAKAAGAIAQNAREDFIGSR